MSKRRLVEREFAAGGRRIVEDERGGTPRPYLNARGRQVKVTRDTPGAWKGRTWFFLKETVVAEEAARKKRGLRYKSKSMPRGYSEMDNTLKQSGAELAQRGVLSKGLTIHGLERLRFANAQIERIDLRASYLGKQVEE